MNLRENFQVKKFESELAGQVEEPTNQAYDTAKEEPAAEEEAPAEEPAAAGGPAGDA